MASRKTDEDEGLQQAGLLERLKGRTSQPGTRGVKYREFLACEDEIREALAQGYTLREIWEVLTEDKRITLAYGTFGTYVNRRIGRRGARRSPGQEVLVEGAEGAEGELDPEAAKRKRLVGV